MIAPVIVLFLIFQQAYLPAIAHCPSQNQTVRLLPSLNGLFRFRGSCLINLHALFMPGNERVGQEPAQPYFLCFG